MSSVHALAARSVLAVAISLVPALARAQSINAAWDFSPAADAVTSYEVCVGTRSLACDDVRWSAPPTQNWFQFTATRGVLHLVTVRAVSRTGAGPYAPEVRVSTPRLSPIGDRSAVVGGTVTVDPVVTDPDNSAVSFSATYLPPGIVIDGRTGRLSGRPTTAGSYRPTVTVADALGSDAQSFVWTVTTSGSGGTGGGTSPMTSVALSIAPVSPQPVGTPVVLSAQGRGGSGPAMYRFWVQPWGGAWQIAQDWSASATHTWRPAGVGGYNISVSGRTGTTGDGVGDSRTFVVAAAAGGGGGGTGGGGTGGGGTRPMTSATMSFTPSTPQPANTSIVITAQGQGGSGPAMYRFWIQPWGGQWQLVQDWSATSTYTWRPRAAGGYNVGVYARTGSSGDGVGTSQNFVIR